MFVRQDHMWTAIAGRPVKILRKGKYASKIHVRTWRNNIVECTVRNEYLTNAGYVPQEYVFVGNILGRIVGVSWLHAVVRYAERNATSYPVYWKNIIYAYTQLPLLWSTPHKE